MTRAVLFDLDGVLVTSYEAWFLILNAAAEELGYPAIPREKYQVAWGQSVDADVRAFFPGQDPGRVADLYDGLLPRFVHAIEADPEGSVVLATLRERGIKTAVVTNSPHALARTVLDAHELRADTLVAGNDVPHAKPAPDMLLLACERLRVETAEATLIGDSRFDREAARAAGIRFIGFRTEGDDEVSRLTDILGLL